MNITSTTSRTGIRVQVRAVHRAFDTGVIALDGIDMDVAPGEFLAILGPSGCGKSTLLRLIAGLDQPQGGSVAVNDDEDITSFSPGGHAGFPELKPGVAAGAKQDNGSNLQQIAYVFQDAHLLPWRTVLHNVALPLEFLHNEKRERLDVARRAIEQVGLSETINRYPNQLSGGQAYRRVSLARAMVADPKLLLLDEPFAALDEITRQRLDEQLRELWAQRGMTVLFVTHSTTEAVFLAQRAVVMTRRPGRIIEDHRIDLPANRSAQIRATPEFAREMRVLYAALERGGA